MPCHSAIAVWQLQMTASLPYMMQVALLYPDCAVLGNALFANDISPLQGDTVADSRRPQGSHTILSMLPLAKVLIK